MLALFFNRFSTFYFLFFSHFFEIFLIFIPWLIIWCFFLMLFLKGFAIISHASISSRISNVEQGR